MTAALKRSAAKSGEADWNTQDGLMHKARRGRFHDSTLDREFVRVLPGDYFATQDNIALTTVLGSCVAACIYDPRLPVGGMNHFMLPNGGADVASDSARYGLYAMEVLINELLRLGARKTNLRAKVFGGGRVLRNMVALNVGARNSAFVIEFLANERIPVVSQDLEDVFARKVLFFPLTGRALVKRIDPSSEDSIARNEVEYSQSISKRPVAGDIELF
jgi:chemotaxis protein CheD